jgi:hypothetical protein
MLNLNITGVEITQKKGKSKKPSFRVEDKIKKTLLEWNTIEGVELYEKLYNICSQLFLATQNHKLECLNYYIDYERDCEKGEEYTVMYAEIKNTYDLPMIERYNQHKELLKRVLSNDKTLIYSKYNFSCNPYNEIDENTGQLSLFR